VADLLGGVTTSTEMKHGLFDLVANPAVAHVVGVYSRIGRVGKL